MTSTIHVLPDHVRNLIAAGEVVERPASVVKELIENSIDAGARSIEVAVEGGGRTLLSVADDGEGMTSEDAVRCLDRHATSKLKTAEDLKNIGSLGFRGEALPAIASVSDFTLTTRAAGTDHATSVRVRYGQVEEGKDAPRAQGTTVEVRGLFARTPARSRFLKAKATEVRWITQVFTAYAMAYPELGFSMTVDGKRRARYAPAAGFDSRVRDVLGTSIPWTPIEDSNDGIRMEGLISEPDAGRSSTGHIYFFVNRRWVTSRPLMQTLLRAYSPFLPQRRYPAAVIYLEIGSSEVDVNVHPTKREIRFREQGRVCNALFHALEGRLRELRKGRFAVDTPVTSPGGRGVREARADYKVTRPQLPGQIEAVLEEAQASLKSPLAEGATPGVLTGAGEGPHLVTTLAGTYLVAVDGEDLVLIDQHAAHERVLYEQAQKALEGSPPARQSLLLPLTLDLTPDEAQTLEEYREDLRKLGFDVGPFGGRSVLVEAIPADLKRWENGQVLRDILEEMGQASGAKEDRISHVAASYACHSSVRAGDTLSPEEQTALLARLFACKDWHRCPHGRPTVVRLDRGEIERRFRRP
jgi:DNA mismatch repair protein MutL